MQEGHAMDVEQDVKGMRAASVKLLRGSADLRQGCRAETRGLLILIDSFASQTHNEVTPRSKFWGRTSRPFPKPRGTAGAISCLDGHLARLNERVEFGPVDQPLPPRRPVDLQFPGCDQTT